jgi:hypothetical protein
MSFFTISEDEGNAPEVARQLVAGRSGQVQQRAEAFQQQEGQQVHPQDHRQVEGHGVDGFGFRGQ